eukprot:TRINITY_DN2581_c0_g1_i2.p1 TRINITY_DN2581_c0_g1~~TRINITY_DN2581_c0_g1_i2.p1  ORF type:complete len:221 (+),score=36.22 TRINITY_DN2581_c0_g1_i2:283-945(+)
MESDQSHLSPHPSNSGSAKKDSILLSPGAPIRRSESLVTLLKRSSETSPHLKRDEEMPTAKEIHVPPEEVLEGVLRIRKLELEDFHKGFVELLSQLTSTGNITFSMFEDRWREVQKNPDQVVLVIENIQTNRIVAAGTLLVERKFIHEGGTCGHVEDIVVDTTQRGQNLGKRIVEKLRTVGAACGCYKVILDCNEDLVGFYEKCGFKKKAVQMAWYSEEH